MQKIQVLIFSETCWHLTLSPVAPSSLHCPHEQLAAVAVHTRGAENGNTQPPGAKTRVPAPGCG